MLLEAVERTLRLVWRRRSRRGFFLRPEEFFVFARRIATSCQKMDELTRDVLSHPQRYL